MELNTSTWAFAISWFIPLNQETPSNSSCLKIPIQDFNSHDVLSVQKEFWEIFDYFFWYQLHNPIAERALALSNGKDKQKFCGTSSQTNGKTSTNSLNFEASLLTGSTSYQVLSEGDQEF